MTGPKELLEDGQEEVFSQTAVERGLAFDPPAMSEEDIRAADLATALAAIVQQIDISDYRDKRGNTAKNNVAFIHAQQLVTDTAARMIKFARRWSATGTTWPPPRAG